MPCNYDKIRADNILEYGQGTRHLSFLNRLYTDRTHFLFELLQNAEDAGASRVLFQLFEDKLEVFHDGRLFNEKDVRGICGVGEGTKTEDLTQIGKFGIGFKSVYAYTSTPEVHSKDESFRIENYVRPFTVQARVIGNSWTTLFVFPFNREDVEPEIACEEISGRLNRLSARTLLFLRKIKEIEYILPDGIDGTYLRDEAIRGNAREVTVIGQNTGEDESESWLIFERPVELPDPGEDCPRHVPVEIGFCIEKNEKEQRDEVVRVKDSQLVVYFPTEKETRFSFLIQGPYKTTPARDNIPKDDDWNAMLVRETACLITDVLQQFKDLGLLDVPLLETLPIRMDDFSPGSVFYPIVVAVRKALATKELLPADDGSFVSARNAKLASGVDIKNLLNHNQLSTLFQSRVTIKWLAGSITKNRTPELHIYLLNELDIEEVTPDSFARKITKEFLSEQINEWFIEFYKYLSDHQTLWKPSRVSWATGGILRTKEILRLQDDSLVVPFQSDRMTPNAYLTSKEHLDSSFPIVKTEISQDEDVKRFLIELGIPELDIVAEVIEKVLPKYKNSTVTKETHLNDIEQILKAHQIEDPKKREILKGKLCETPFIMEESLDDEATTYRRSCELYFLSDELHVYFSGNSSFGFVNQNYSRCVMEMFEELGVQDSVKIQKRKINKQGYIDIENSNARHERGLNGFDPEITVDGLEYAMRSITRNKSEFVWNNIAIPNADCIRGIVEKSTNQNYKNSTKIEQFSNFGKFLMDFNWLPDLNGNMHKPSDLLLEELPDSFKHDEKLAKQLRMKQNVIGKFAEEIGIPMEDIELLKQHYEEFQQWKISLSAKTQPPAFPIRSSSNKDRRDEQVSKQYDEAPKKKYKDRRRSVRTTKGTIDPKPWLKNQYTNDSGQMICQICKEKMPFKKRNDEYYFEHVEAFTEKYFPREHEAQFLALCPLCAAKYKEFVKKEKTEMENLRDLIMNSKELEVPLVLENLPTSIRFVETHASAIRIILYKSMQKKEDT